MKLRDSSSSDIYLYAAYETTSASPAPLETPSHNGEWKGKIPVRTVPAGVMGTKDFAPIKFGETRKTGDIRSQMAREVAYVMEKRRIAGLRSKQRRKMPV